MAGGGGGGGGANPGDDSAFNIIWMIFFVFLLLAVIWYFWGVEIKTLFLLVKKYQLLTVQLILKLLPIKYLDNVKAEISNMLDLIAQTDPAGLSLDMITYLSGIVGKYIRVPVTIVLIFFSYIGFCKNPANRYKKTYDMHSLARQERIQWPQINPVIGLNLVQESLNKGPWAMGKSPLEFCKDEQLLIITTEKVTNLKSGNQVLFKMQLDQEKAHNVFVKQLGNLWRTPEALPMYKQAIFAVFLARACREPKVASSLLEQINRSCDSSTPGNLNFDKVPDIWRKYYNQRIIQEIIRSHAYEFTIFIDLLLLARQDGVLATADFLWLKPIDRSFWYVLNSTGRQTYFSEAAGSHAHFLVEKALGRALSVPYVGEATKALQIALNEIIYVPSEEEKQQLLQETNS